MKKLIFIFIILFFVSCNSTLTQNITDILMEWKDRKVIFPERMTYIMQGDTVNFVLSTNRYKILSYVDSLGCMSCKLNIGGWKELIQYYDSVIHDSLQYMLVFNSNEESYLSYILEKEHFSYPVCLDSKDSLNSLNNFPKEMAFQTFLLDQDNKVVAIGNPVHNPQIKKLYLNIILGKKNELSTQPQTTAVLSESYIDMGTFEWEQKQTVDFTILNTGEELLIVNEILTSCGCTTVEYSKEPILPNKTLSLKVEYKAEHPEHFDKTITVYCSAKGAPFQLKIRGNAN